ncbi:glutamate racemase [Pseudothermotoga thermarum]|uniref:Glutamate racemase n=1 Tax=Pseudothermotoga thermarum DSM 5069 TaxID=688269 RepID=F7YVG7_9THEM|nr:aspartate/glutamate racemase family protein [Pseudothermotoga thermarum]AEH50478.1 Glutamate racemase [Pseudothermotoga thermarum DSM 5069]
MRVIGLFDSGVGGLSVLKHLIAKGVAEEYVYVADTAHAPYGTKDQNTIVDICVEIVDFLKSLEVETILAACNTADISLKISHIDFDVPYLGVTDVEFPNLESVAIWGTKAAIESHFHKKIFETKGTKVILEMPLQELVKIVEEGLEDSQFAKDCVDKAVDEVVKAGVENVVLGCTHFSLIVDKLRKRYPKINFVDPAEILAERIAKAVCGFSHPKKITFYITGDEKEFEIKLKRYEHLLQIPYTIVEKTATQVGVHHG